MSNTTAFKIIITVTLPFLIAWVWIAELFSNIRTAFWYARQEVRIVLGDYRKLMRMSPVQLTNYMNLQKRKAKR